MGRFLSLYFLLLFFSHPVVSDSLWPHGLQHARPPCPSPPHSLPKFMSIASVMPLAISSSDALFSFCPSIFPSIRDFSNELAVPIRWPKYWSSGFSISPSNEYSGLISLKIDWFDILAVPGEFQGSSPAPQFEGSINSLVFCLLYHPALTTMHDHWEDHRLD